MIARGVPRVVARVVQNPIRSHANQIRFASGSQPGRKSGSSPGLVGLAGAGLLFAAGYSYNHYYGSKSMASAASSAKKQLEKLSQDIPANAPESNQGLPWLHSTAVAYAAFIPGAQAFIDSAFNDLESVQKKQGKRVDDIVRTAHRDLKDATKNGLDLESVGKAWEIIEKAVNQIGNLAAESSQDILSQDPDIKAKVGDKLDQLKKMAEDFGPEARKEFDDAYEKIKDLLSSGLGSDNIEKIRKLIQEKIQTVEKFGNVAWERGMEESKPFLDKNPRLRAIVEENKESLRHGNLEELWESVKEASSSGNTEPVEKFIKDLEQRRRDR